MNTITAILGIGVEVFGDGGPAGHRQADGLLLFLLLVRIVEVIADTIPLVGLLIPCYCSPCRGHSRCG